MIFWDTSALVKAYLQEIGTPSVLGAFESSRGFSFLNEFVALEVRVALVRALRDKKLSKVEYRKAVSEFTRDYPSSFAVLPVEGPVSQMAFRFVEIYQASSVGPLDLIHLASAVQMQRLVLGRVAILASSDDRLLQVAKQEGLETFNPATDPLGSLLKLLPRRR